MRIPIIATIGLTAFLSLQARTGAAAVTFFLSPGTNPNGDLAWQATVGSFTEFDLNGFSSGQLVQSLSAGPTTITVGPAAAGQQIFFGSFAGGGGVNGTVSGGSLLNRTAGGIITPTLTFTFSQPVPGFGLWIFDDGSCCPNSFVMTVTEFGGGSATSGILDAVPGGTAHIVEGFLAATSSLGITSVTITPLSGGAFEVDHLQVGDVGNTPPVCSTAQPSIASLWPLTQQFVPVTILGVTDPDGDAVFIIIESIFQDEPVSGVNGNTSPDGEGVGTNTVQLRAARDGTGNGRVYHVTFRATDPRGGNCTGAVRVGVPHNQSKNGTAIDDGALYDSTVP